MFTIRGQCGQSLLEFALLAPFVLFLLLALVDFGIAIDRKIVLDHAVREGARFASVGGHALEGSPADEAVVEAYTTDQAQDIPDSVDVCYVDDNGTAGFGLGDTVRVQANYEHDFVTGFGSFFGLSLGPIDMDVDASARAEYAIAGVGVCA
jgi:Flp pilus assembly protein TadG